MKYEVRSLDVWGNEEDGFDVNDSWRIGEVEISDDADPIEVLFEEGYLSDIGRVRSEVQYDDDGMMTIACEMTGKPLYLLFATKATH